MSKIRILFLDIDGVIVLEKWGTPNWKKQCVNNLVRFLKVCPDVKIVLSTTWRIKPKLVYHFMSLMAYHNISLDRFMGIIPDISLLHRDKEVITYLNNLAKSRLMLDVEDYVSDWVVIDDAPEFFINGEVPNKHLEIVNRKVGFTSELADKLIKRFKEQ